MTLRPATTMTLLALSALLIGAQPAAQTRLPGDSKARTIGESRRFTASLTEDRDCLCHFPPGQPGRAQTLCVGGRAAEAHMRHGDTMGACDATQSEQICDDGIDNDGDSLIDCQDPDCVGQPGPDPLALRSSPFSSSLWGNSRDMLADERRSALGSRDTDQEDGLCEQAESTCSDGFDNDGDGLIDCDDSDCTAAPACDPPAIEDCDDGVDNDGDTMVDCQDEECIGDTGPSGEVCQQPESSCGDTFDNDGDLRIDCDDSDCAADPLCQSPVQEVCDDGIDNDDDTLVDCQDDECTGQTGPAGETCQQPELSCDDGFDNDGDSLTDCDDSDCSGAANCQTPGTEICNDELDNDQDGKTDCADEDCLGQDGAGGVCQAMEMTCDDGFDNDADGFADCADIEDCLQTGACDIEQVCDDGLDNDLDFKTDCEDEDCSEDPACTPV